jgi:hypothetical protein
MFHRLQQEPDRVEAVLLMPRSVQALVKLFRTAQLVTFTSILQSFIGLPSRSHRLAVCFAEHDVLLKELFRRLAMQEIKDNAIVLSQLLKLFVVLLDTGRVPPQSVHALRMREVVRSFCDDSRVLVKELAADIFANKLPVQS